MGAAQAQTVRRIRDVNAFGREFYWETVPNPTGDPLVGLFGHEMLGRRWRYQFRVMAATPRGHVVQLFSALDGFPTDLEVWPTERIERCRFFKNPTHWRDKADEENASFEAFSERVPKTN